MTPPDSDRRSTYGAHAGDDDEVPTQIDSSFADDALDDVPWTEATDAAEHTIESALARFEQASMAFAVVARAARGRVSEELDLEAFPVLSDAIVVPPAPIDAMPDGPAPGADLPHAAAPASSAAPAPAPATIASPVAAAPVAPLAAAQASPVPDAVRVEPMAAAARKPVPVPPPVSAPRSAPVSAPIPHPVQPPMPAHAAPRSVAPGRWTMPPFEDTRPDEPVLRASPARSAVAPPARTADTPVPLHLPTSLSLPVAATPQPAAPARPGLGIWLLAIGALLVAGALASAWFAAGKPGSRPATTTSLAAARTAPVVAPTPVPAPVVDASAPAPAPSAEASAPAAVVAAADPPVAAPPAAAPQPPVTTRPAATMPAGAAKDRPQAAIDAAIHAAQSKSDRFLSPEGAPNAGANADVKADASR